MIVSPSGDWRGIDLPGNRFVVAGVKPKTTNAFAMPYAVLFTFWRRPHPRHHCLLARYLVILIFIVNIAERLSFPNANPVTIPEDEVPIHAEKYYQM